MKDNKTLLVPDATYHIYNRANGNERLFILPSNYHYFLKQYKIYISPIARTYCYCLMPNHFHFLMRIKSEAELLNLTGFKNLSGLGAIENKLSQNFSNFFNSYSKAINKQEGRKGSLFIRPFKKKKIDNTKYLLKLVHYIHFNPVESGLCKAPENWEFSSYKSILSDSPTLLERKEVIEWFNDKENFVYVHQHPPELTGINI